MEPHQREVLLNALFALERPSVEALIWALCIQRSSMESGSDAALVVSALRHLEGAGRLQELYDLVSRRHGDVLRNAQRACAPVANGDGLDVDALCRLMAAERISDQLFQEAWWWATCEHGCQLEGDDARRELITRLVQREPGGAEHPLVLMGQFLYAQIEDIDHRAELSSWLQRRGGDAAAAQVEVRRWLVFVVRPAEQSFSVELDAEHQVEAWRVTTRGQESWDDGLHIRFEPPAHQANTLQEQLEVWLSHVPTDVDVISVLLPDTLLGDLLEECQIPRGRRRVAVGRRVPVAVASLARREQWPLHREYAASLQDWRAFWRSFVEHQGPGQTIDLARLCDELVPGVHEGLILSCCPCEAQMADIIESAAPVVLWARGGAVSCAPGPSAAWRRWVFERRCDQNPESLALLWDNPEQRLRRAALRIPVQQIA